MFDNMELSFSDLQKSTKGKGKKTKEFQNEGGS